MNYCGFEVLAASTHVAKVVGATLGERHTSVTALHMCIYTCLD